MSFLLCNLPCFKGRGKDYSELLLENASVDELDVMTKLGLEDGNGTLDRCE